MNEICTHPAKAFLYLSVNVSSIILLLISSKIIILTIITNYLLLFHKFRHLIKAINFREINTIVHLFKSIPSGTSHENDHKMTFEPPHILRAHTHATPMTHECFDESERRATTSDDERRAERSSDLRATIRVPIRAPIGAPIRAPNHAERCPSRITDPFGQYSSHREIQVDSSLMNMYEISNFLNFFRLA